MTGKIRIALFALGLWLAAGTAGAEMQVELYKRQSLDKAPLAIAQSVADGRLFVLLEGGVVQILSAEGQLQERFQADKEVTTLEVSPDGKRLYLGSAPRKELQFIELSNIYDLPVSSSARVGEQTGVT